MRVVKELDIEIIAPQHGNVFRNKRDIAFLIQKLESFEKIGIDALGK